MRSFERHVQKRSLKENTMRHESHVKAFMLARLLFFEMKTRFISSLMNCPAKFDMFRLQFGQEQKAVNKGSE
jgi:hypothetical protein